MLECMPMGVVKASPGETTAMASFTERVQTAWQAEMGHPERRKSNMVRILILASTVTR